MANGRTTTTLNISTTIATEIHSFNFTIKFISTFLLIIIIVLTLLGNSLVIRAFVAFRKLRNVTNYFVVSLAVTDILVAVFSMPVWVAYLLTGPQWQFSMWLMKIWQSVDILCGVASISHLLLISIERYICISTPLTYHSVVTTPKTRVAICAAWSFALLMTVIKTRALGKVALHSLPTDRVLAVFCGACGDHELRVSYDLQSFSHSSQKDGVKDWWENKKILSPQGT